MPILCSFSGVCSFRLPVSGSAAVHPTGCKSGAVAADGNGRGDADEDENVVACGNAVACGYCNARKLVGIVVNVQHSKFVVVVQVLAATCQIARPRTYLTYSDPGQSLGS